MIKFKKDCYAAYVSIDEVHSSLFGYFTNKSDAETASKGQGWYGSNGSVNRETINIKIYESLEEFNNRHKVDRLIHLLDKLSEEDIGLLKNHFAQK